MSLKPLILIFLEIAQPTATPSTPDLNTVIVGPAYDVLDYLDDGASTLLASPYGTLESPPTTYTPPATGAVAVTVLDSGYPGQSAGSRVDHDSVGVTLREPRVIMGSTISTLTDAPVLAAGITTSSSDRTLITLTTPAINFIAAGIRAGDRLILRSSSGQDYTRLVASVGEPNSDNLATTGNESLLRITEELPASGTGDGQWAYTTTGEMRIERVLATQTLDDATKIVFPEPGSDKLTVMGGIALDVTLSPMPSVTTPSPTVTSVTRPLSYAPVYLSYRALRQDLLRVGSALPSDLVSVNGVPTVRGLGKIDARNPLAVAVNLAILNAGNTPIYFWGVGSDDAAGHTYARARTATRSDLYAFVPLTQDIQILGAYKVAFEQQASPDYARSTGIKQRFRIVLGSLALPTATTLFSETISGIATAVSGAASGYYRTLRIDSASTGTDLAVADVLPGHTIAFGLSASGLPAWENRRGTHRISHVNSSFDSGVADTVVEIIPGSSRWDDTGAAAADDVEFEIRDATNSVLAHLYASVVVSTGTGPILGFGSIRYTRLGLTRVGGPYTITYVDSGNSDHNVTINVTGFTITLTMGDLTTHEELRDAVNGDAILSLLVLAEVTAGGTQAVEPASQSPASPTSILPGSGTCTAEIEVNDDLFNDIVDSTATFLADDIRAGDIVEFPLDPNNYGADAFEGRLLSYQVASVLSETRLRIANGFDDDASTARELPHYYLRDYANRLIDNAAPNALNYRVRRILSDDEAALVAITQAQSVRSKRLTLIFPDEVKVADLRDGSLTRSTPTVRTLASWLPSFYLAACVGGVVAGTPAQMGLTNGTFVGISQLRNSSDRFTEEQLSLINDGGYFLCDVEAEGALPYCVHQLTTDPTTLETGELSVVKNLDFIMLGYQAVLQPFLGLYNNIPEALGDIQEAVDGYSAAMRGRRIARIGPPLLEGKLISLAPSETAGDTSECFFQVKIPKPLNNIGFHLVVMP